ncbi:hypothetical protein Noda2021_00840 [Candidatus Dependentiae bacterium Noda2021]|nr:hypothetical protein Noda2021_00840 [Candidatus Dependentiae bacterium Noda2021]
MNNSLVQDVKTYFHAHVLAWRNPAIILVTLLAAAFFYFFNYSFYTSMSLLASHGRTLGPLDYFIVPLVRIFENTLQFLIVGAIAYYIAQKNAVTLSQSFKVASSHIISFVGFAIIQFLFSRTLVAQFPQWSLVITLIDTLIRVFLLFYAVQFCVLASQNAVTSMTNSSKLVLKTIGAVIISLIASFILGNVSNHALTSVQRAFGPAEQAYWLSASTALTLLDQALFMYLKVVTLGIYATLLYGQKE